TAGVTHTPTPTPSATPTPTATTSLAALRCCGDANGDGMVTQTEVQQCLPGPIVTNPASSACDCDGDGEVTLAEIQDAANNEVAGCPATPTPSPDCVESIDP
ncbi:MAG TPA: hypothetical protein VL403_00475, partial [Candidatus Kryptonia bacterium]|nr:hypothetical protein [Candidatus Kryptonia bacterium]